jgi:hypothetical protein
MFGITHLNSSRFQSLQWFDGLTMSGFIPNCFAPFKEVQGSNVQEFKENFYV